MNHSVGYRTKQKKYKKGKYMVHNIFHVDEKTLTPDDVVGSNQRPKTIIGRPKIYDLKGNLLAEEDNLVVLLGREYLAQMLTKDSADPANGNPNDYSKYKLSYFGVGDGGTTNDCPPQTVGPYDDDTDLVNRVVIKEASAGATEPDYIDGGKLKRIESDGSIEIVQEEHTINTNAGGQTVVQRYTSIKYTMYLQAGEPARENDDDYFKFNEAGLYAAEFDDDGHPTGENILFARFTTLDKYLESQDGIMIEWYILV